MTEPVIPCHSRGIGNDESLLVKLTADRPFSDPEKAARRILEIANAVELVQGRIHIEKINEPFLFRDRGSPAEYGAGFKLAIERGWLKMHESGTFVTFTPAGAELFARAEVAWNGRTI
jgi:hypothetical protein